MNANMSQMKNKLLLNLLLIRIIHIILAIIIAPVVALLMYFATSFITANLKIIIISVMAGVWVAEVVLYIIRSKIFYRKRLASITEDDPLTIKGKQKTLKSRYILFVILFSIFLGYSLYMGIDPLVYSLAGGTGNYKSADNNNYFLVAKISIGIGLLVFFIIKGVNRKKRMANLK